jgi:hypothetical protein
MELAMASLLPCDLDWLWIRAWLFLIVVAEEGLGRWLFYESRMQVN